MKIREAGRQTHTHSLTQSIRGEYQHNAPLFLKRNMIWTLERERKKRRKRERKRGSARIKAIILLGAEFALLS